MSERQAFFFFFFFSHAFGEADDHWAFLTVTPFQEGASQSALKNAIKLDLYVSVYIVQAFLLEGN